MATPANPLPRFQLPARIRANRSTSQGTSAIRTLADRLAQLPGVEVVEYGADTLPCQMIAYMLERATRVTVRNPRMLSLCRVTEDGIVVHGLDNWARHQVVMRGWGKLFCDRVLLFLPRNCAELETCWSIIRQAYGAHSDPSASKLGPNYSLAWDLPKYSRTTLQ